MFSFRIQAIILALLVTVSFSGLAWADDATGSAVVSGIGEAAESLFTHEDADPFKGWFNLTIENSGNVPWTAMHFSFFDVPGQPSAENAIFIVTPPYEPTSSQSPLTWTVDNAATLATLDLYFTADPILPGETGTFSVYTQNTDQVPFFGLAVFPTPEPATFTILAIATTIIFRRK